MYPEEVLMRAARGGKPGWWHGGQAVAEESAPPRGRLVKLFEAIRRLLRRN